VSSIQVPELKVHKLITNFKLGCVKNYVLSLYVCKQRTDWLCKYGAEKQGAFQTSSQLVPPNLSYQNYLFNDRKLLAENKDTDLSMDYTSSPLYIALHMYMGIHRYRTLLL